MSEQVVRLESELFERAAGIIEAAQRHLVRTVNTAMVRAYWLIGREIVEVEQAGKERARYGAQMIERLAERLSGRFGRGFNTSNLKRMRQFYVRFPDGSQVPEELGGSQNGAALRRLSSGDENGAALRHQSGGSAEPRFPPQL